MVKEDSFFMTTLPVLIGTVILAMVCTVLLLKYVPVLRTDAPSVMVFDIIKYANAQRAVASSILVDKELRVQNEGETLLMLKDISQRTKDVITKKAGSNSLVLIKQAVVQGEYIDITDAVLTELGLPTNVTGITAYQGPVGKSTTIPKISNKNADTEVLP